MWGRSVVELAYGRVAARAEWLGLVVALGLMAAGVALMVHARLSGRRAARLAAEVGALGLMVAAELDSASARNPAVIDDADLAKADAFRREVEARMARVAADYEAEGRRPRGEP